MVLAFVLMVLAFFQVIFIFELNMIKNILLNGDVELIKYISYKQKQLYRCKYCKIVFVLKIN